MENTHATHTDLGAVDQLNAVRRNQAQRLLDMAEALLQNLEAVDLPKDAVGIDRTAKALLSVAKTMNALHDAAAGLAKQSAVKDSMTTDPEVEAEARATALQIYRAAQEPRLQSQALRRVEDADEQAGETTVSPKHHWP